MVSPIRLVSALQNGYADTALLF